jgi:hypothetical protein
MAHQRLKGGKRRLSTGQCSGDGEEQPPRSRGRHSARGRGKTADQGGGNRRHNTSRSRQRLSPTARQPGGTRPPGGWGEEDNHRHRDCTQPVQLVRTETRRGERGIYVRDSAQGQRKHALKEWRSYSAHGPKLARDQRARKQVSKRPLARTLVSKRGVALGPKRNAAYTKEQYEPL